MERLKHVLESQQFRRPLLEELFARAHFYERSLAEKQRGMLRLPDYPMLFSVFYEPSTRTRLSFAAAAKRLGIDVRSTENARDFSSAIKGETLEDTIRVLCGYHPDLIVLRHSEIGAAARAAAVSNVPIINAGDGGGQHPTQALLDLYTILSEFPNFKSLTVVFGGDLRYGRTVRSLAYLLTRYNNVHVVFVAPDELQVRQDICDYLDRKGLSWSKESSVEKAVKEADVVYWTRLQEERLPAEDLERFRAEKIADRYVITAELAERMKPEAIIMHPLPRVKEISVAVDDNPRARYFKQAENGLYVRMALMAHLLGR
jgi:aspartate carbamoyltransferase catalytic subunit